MSPTALTLKQLRAEGYTARVVEQTVHAPGRVFKRDCFGFDVLAVKSLRFGGGSVAVLVDGGVLGVQACAACDHSKRKAKILLNQESAQWIASGAKLEVWSWQTRRSEERTKAGKRSKRLVHHLRREEIRLSDFVPNQEQTREAL